MSYHLLLCSTFVAVLFHAMFAPDAEDGSRQGGKYHVATAKTYNMQSQDHARMLKKYAALSDQMPSAVVREHVAAIRFNADAARRSYVRLANSAGDNEALAKRVEQLQQRLDKVNATLKQLDSEAKAETAASRAVIARTTEISQQLLDNHRDLGRIDDNFYDSDSDSYYTTGEGHFVD